MKHQRVAVRVAEEGHSADTGVKVIALELHAFLLELGASLVHMGDAQRDVRAVRPVNS